MLNDSSVLMLVVFKCAVTFNAFVAKEFHLLLQFLPQRVIE